MSSAYLLYCINARKAYEPWNAAHYQHLTVAFKLFFLNSLKLKQIGFPLYPGGGTLIIYVTVFI